MLDGLLGRGFCSKCNSLVKLTKSRIDVVRRKRMAMMKFLKKDIADLLSNGLDINAYGRAEGLLVESTVSFCYDYIEETCDFVLKHLSVIQKQKECPEECKEAVASLMFAAARISDLPELRDLRQMFHERYGNSLEYFANKQFVEKLSSKPARMESKLHLMQDIAVEFSIRWDSMAFQQRMSNPSVSAQEQNKNYGPSCVDADNSRSVHKEDYDPKGDRHKLAYKEGHELPPKYDDSSLRRKEGHIPKRAEIDLQSRRGITENGHTSLNGAKRTVPRYDSCATSVQGGQEIKVEKHETWIQKEDRTPRKDRFCNSSYRNGQENPDERSKLYNERGNDATIRVADVPPYVNPGFDPMAGCKYDGQRTEAERLRPYYYNSIPPPYVKPNTKPKDNKYRDNSVFTLSDFESDGGIKESSAHDRPDTGNRSGRVRSGDHFHHGRHDGLVRMNGHDHHEDGVTDEHLRKTKSVRRSHSRSGSHHDGGDIGDSERPAVPARKSKSNRRDDPRRGLQVPVGDQREEKDEDGRVIERLFMHYIKKPTLELIKLRKKHKSRRPHREGTDAGESPWNSRSKDKYHEEAETAHAPIRSSSLPREQSAPSEATKVFARAATFQPDRSGPAQHVHPKLPDYDDLAARFASL